MVKGTLIAAMNIGRAAEDEFHDWYDTEHLPERQRVPGFLLCQRWIGAQDGRVSVATYDLQALLAGIGERARDVPLIGATTAGEIATHGPGDSGVVVVALGGAGFSVATAAAEDASSRLREAGAEVAGCLAETEPREHSVLLLLTDGLAGDQQEIVRGAHSVAGAAVPLVGGCAGDDLKMSTTFQLHGGSVDAELREVGA